MNSLLLLDKEGNQKVIQFIDRDVAINTIVLLAKNGVITKEQAADYCDLLRLKSLERVIRNGILIFEITKQCDI